MRLSRYRRLQRILISQVKRANKIVQTLRGPQNKLHRTALHKKVATEKLMNFKANDRDAKMFFISRKMDTRYDN